MHWIVPAHTHSVIFQYGYCETPLSLGSVPLIRLTNNSKVIFMKFWRVELIYTTINKHPSLG